jgi:hypothetical protein
MSSTPATDDDPDAEPPALPPASDRCVALETGAGTVLIYAEDNHRAWIESDTAASADAMV